MTHVFSLCHTVIVVLFNYLTVRRTTTKLLLWKNRVGGAEFFWLKTWFYDMFKNITTQTKSQRIVIDFVNKPYDNYWKKAKKDKKSSIFFQPFVFVKTQPSLFFRFEKTKQNSKFPHSISFLAFKISSRRVCGNKTKVGLTYPTFLSCQFNR